MKTIPIVDVFYYGGEPIAELRLQYLDACVDMFVMIVGDQPHPTYLKDVIQPFEHKTKVVTTFADAVASVQESCSEFIVIVSRAYEIPSADVVRTLPARYFGLQQPLGLQMQVFYQNFANAVTGVHTTRPYCINDVGVCQTNFHERCDTLYIPTAGWCVEPDDRSIIADTQHVLYLPTAIQEFHNKLVFLQRYIQTKK
jgi:hypothetical protein